MNRILAWNKTGWNKTGLLPADRPLRLQALTRGDEGFVLSLAYSTQRGYGRTHAFVGELGEVGLVTGGPQAAGSPGPEHPPLPFAPPGVTFREELLTFGASCGEIPGTSLACNQNPVGGGLPGPYKNPAGDR